VPFDQVPREAGHEAQVQWLYDWWERIDSWITENRPGGAPLPAVAAVPDTLPAETAGELFGPEASGQRRSLGYRPARRA